MITKQQLFTAIHAQLGTTAPLLVFIQSCVGMAFILLLDSQLVLTAQLVTIVLNLQQLFHRCWETSAPQELSARKHAQSLGYRLFVV